MSKLWLHGAARTELHVHTGRSRGRFAARRWTDRAEDGGCAQGGGTTPRRGQSFLRFDRVRKRDRSQAYFERQLEGRMSALGQKQTSAMSERCPLYPQKRTLVERVGMSALCQKRTLCGATKATGLFDHLVGELLELIGHVET